MKYENEWITNEDFIFYLCAKNIRNNYSKLDKAVLKHWFEENIYYFKGGLKGKNLYDFFIFLEQKIEKEDLTPIITNLAKKLGINEETNSERIKSYIHLILNKVPDRLEELKELTNPSEAYHYLSCIELIENICNLIKFRHTALIKEYIKKNFSNWDELTVKIKENSDMKEKIKFLYQLGFDESIEDEYLFLIVMIFESTRIEVAWFIFYIFKVRFTEIKELSNLKLKEIQINPFQILSWGEKYAMDVIRVAVWQAATRKMSGKWGNIGEKFILRLGTTLSTKPDFDLFIRKNNIPIHIQIKTTPNTPRRAELSKFFSNFIKEEQKEDLENRKNPFPNYTLGTIYIRSSNPKAVDDVNHYLNEANMKAQENEYFLGGIKLFEFISNLKLADIFKEFQIQQDRYINIIKEKMEFEPITAIIEKKAKQLYQTYFGEKEDINIIEDFFQDR